jgi:hypothetical protein
MYFNAKQPDESSHVEAAVENFFRHYGKPTRGNMTAFFGVNKHSVYDPNHNLGTIIRRAQK